MSTAEDSDLTNEEKIGRTVGRWFGLELETKTHRMVAGVVAMFMGVFHGA